MILLSHISSNFLFLKHVDIIMHGALYLPFLIYSLNISFQAGQLKVNSCYRGEIHFLLFSTIHMFVTMWRKISKWPCFALSNPLNGNATVRIWEIQIQHTTHSKPGSECCLPYWECIHNLITGIGQVFALHSEPYKVTECFLFYFMHINVITKCMSVYHVPDWYPWRSEKSTESPEIRFTDNCPQPCGCWEESWSPLQEQQVF